MTCRPVATCARGAGAGPRARLDRRAGRDRARPPARYGGKVVSFGALSGQPTALDVRQDLIYRNVSHHGFWTFNWLTRAPRAEIDAAYHEIVALVTSGELTADIDSTFRLEQYADALSRAEHDRRHGKVLFVFGD